MSDLVNRGSDKPMRTFHKGRTCRTIGEQWFDSQVPGWHSRPSRPEGFSPPPVLEFPDHSRTKKKSTAIIPQAGALWLAAWKILLNYMITLVFLFLAQIITFLWLLLYGYHVLIHLKLAEVGHSVFSIIFYSGQLFWSSSSLLKILFSMCHILLGTKDAKTKSMSFYVLHSMNFFMGVSNHFFWPLMNKKFPQCWFTTISWNSKNPLLKILVNPWECLQMFQKIFTLHIYPSPFPMY